MKFFVAVLALATAVVAAPAAANSGRVFVKDSTACACVNSQGVFAADELCSRAGGWMTRDLPGGLVSRASIQAQKHYIRGDGGTLQALRLTLAAFFLSLQCYPHTPQALDMTKVFTDEVCKNKWGSEGWDKAVCRPVKLCSEPDIVNDQWVQC
ncbi:hypothetical protein RB595_009532 [Gaeumannomyces hyphopodioides]